MNSRDLKEAENQLQKIIEKMIKEGISEKYLSGFCQVTIQKAGMK